MSDPQASPQVPSQRAMLDRVQLQLGRVEWGTLALMLGCYAAWGAALAWLPLVSVWLAVPVLACLITLQSSLSHEALHGHPFRSRVLNEALMFLPLNLAVPYGRFRDTHLAHHHDERLTDPYDDPETNYLDPAQWRRMGAVQRGLLWVNNTLAGRVLLGPLLGQIRFMIEDAQLIRDGDEAVLRDWLLHLLGAGLTLWLVVQSALPFWAYLLAAYLGLAILKIRTFLEHRAHLDPAARTVIIERGGLLGFLFLNNHLHVVHHCHPGVPWHALPRLYRDRRAQFLARNDGYTYPSYGVVLRRYALRAKDPVAHPIWSERQ
ncbi:fatty acid desaturase [Phaeobacter gallaeciensis]|uniref:Fatty acid desaturase n=1 Tax=Phaeobacter gallaeciensis TaxID=60890 RepID=A0AAC9ZC08_9RHOB|nr:fatty acid desaturase [Phaeobacter gallaeciensis]AHD10381.1 Fatty acid desaturase [Phaeobacter gallaeciensis DSM 26640]ATE93645.1 putative fatty acid desaturase [Phaeobacter gallaeciensis]ATE96534.1 putative fatty acid desaturase [Phaeobacter gallaeciensis]ATF02309.1 putative fatty acid desaturase [Phaeobacter gallaeciensis]ATF06689.1 putative fatty acid desaturase [Phaeobacter gallaeciensis]